MGKEVKFAGTEASSALLNNGQFGHRLCGYPRADRWDRETQLLAALVDADVGLLRTMLRVLGVRP